MFNDNEAPEFIRMNYNILFQFYLWSIENYSRRLTLYITLLSAVIGACVLVGNQNSGNALSICGYLIGSFFLVGLFFLERVVSCQITNIWCIARMNEIRRLIQKRYVDDPVFRTIPLNALRKGLLTKLVPYRLTSVWLIIVMNSFSAASVGSLLLLEYSKTIALVLGILFLLCSFYLQLLYTNTKMRQFDGLIRCEAVQHDHEVERINKPDSIKSEVTNE